MTMFYEEFEQVSMAEFVITQCDNWRRAIRDLEIVRLIEVNMMLRQSKSWACHARNFM